MVEVFKLFIQRIYFLATFRHRNGSFDVCNASMQVMLKAYMIAYHPKNSFETMHGAAEQKLIECSTRMTERFERIAHHVMGLNSLQGGGVSRDLTADLVPLMGEYVECFYSWKRVDEKRLQSRLERMLVATEDSLALCKVENPDDTLNIPAFEESIKKMREKLRMVSGQAALSRYDESRSEARATVLRRTGLLPISNVLAARSSNDELAHELLLDPTFQLLDSGDYMAGTLDEVIRQKFQQVGCCFQLIAFSIP